MQRRLAIGVALLACAYGQAVLALGLGELEVQSHLNQPFAASVPVFGVDDDALDSLQVSLASAEAYRRAGLSRPDDLLNLSFQVVQGAGGPQIRIRGERPAREPLMSLLLQVRGDDGAVLREYAVLLDPPEMAAPAPRTAAVEPAAAPAPVPAPSAAAPAPAATTAAAPDTYGPVGNGETFWSIGTRLRPDAAVTMDQVLLSTYEANPQAFANGSIDELLRGVTLRVPSRAQMVAVEPEVARQRMAALRAAAASGATSAADARLTGQGEAAPPDTVQAGDPLLLPDATVADAAQAPAEDIAYGPPAGDEQAPPSVPEPATDRAINSAHDPAADRAINPAIEPAADRAINPAIEPAADRATEAATDPATGPAGEQPLASAAAGSAAAAGESPQLQAPAAATATRSAPAQVQEEGNPWLLPLIGALVLLALLLGWRTYRQRREAAEAAERESAPATIAAAAAASAAAAGAVPDKAKGATPYVPSPSEVQMLDEALRRDEAPAASPAAGEAQELPLEPAPALAQTNVPQLPDFDAASTLPADTVQVQLDSEDPLAEADFHLAYGLYDEAALLLRQAIEHEPQRMELRVKLADTYFAAQRPMEFLEIAEMLKDEMPPSGWQRIAAMGRQLAPDARLFAPVWPASAAPAAGGTAGAAAEPLQDLDLSAFERTGEPASRVAEEAAPDFELEDLEIGRPESAAEPPPTVEQAAAGSEAGNLLEFDLSEFDLAALGPAEARQAAGRPADEHAPAPDPQLDALSYAAAPELSLSAPKPAMFQDMAGAAQQAAEEQGLVEALATAFELPPQHPSDEAVEVDFSRIDLDALDLDEAAAAGAESTDTDWERVMRELSIDPAIQTPPPAAEPLTPGMPAAAGAAPTQEAALEVELQTFDLSSLQSEDLEAEEAIFDGDEVATKLDLARAYVDMGDHEMARSLLSEVFLQGDDVQKTEADGLLARLPV